MGFKPEELAIMLEEAKQYTDSQRIAYTEPNIFTFNGNPEGKPIAESVMVKISDKILDASTFSKASGFINGQPLEANREDCRIEDYGEGRIFIIMGTISIAMIINSTNSTYQKGLYVICVPEDNSYVSCIEFAETVHPIEPKYLPGVCLPVVELSTAFTGGMKGYTAEENTLLKAVLKGNTPIIVKCDLTIGAQNYTDCSMVWHKVLASGMPCFAAMFASKILQILSMDGGETWKQNSE